MSLSLHHVNAFAASPFDGNPAAVVVSAEPLPESFMRAVARDMNLSETAFLVPRRDADEADDDGNEFDLRWFTPKVEVKLCGHATLASARVLWSSGRATADVPIRFHTKSGLLMARAGAGPNVLLDFPAQRATSSPPPDGLLDALGVASVATATNGTDWLVEVADEATLLTAAPDMRRLASLRARGIAVTAPAGEVAIAELAAKGGPAPDFVSRFFAPAAGVDEDPATGSAHCMLAPWWAAKLDRHELIGYQLSARRGLVGASVVGDRVHLAGRAYIIAEGRLAIAPDGDPMSDR
jgi:PhzF family phenazine biosynthesis protein